MAAKLHKAIGIEVTKQSLDRVRREIQQVNGKIDSGVKQVIVETALKIHMEAVTDAPVKTGSLKTSYQIDTSEISNNIASVYTDIFYAPNVEYGFGQPAQPHFEPAVKRNEAKFEKAIEALIKKSIK